MAGKGFEYSHIRAGTPTSMALTQIDTVHTGNAIVFGGSGPFLVGGNENYLFQGYTLILFH